DDQPAHPFVAGFIGSPAMNLCTLPMSSNGNVPFGGASVSLSEDVLADARSRGCRELVVGLRPEALELGDGGCAAEIEVVEEHGADAFVFCAADVAGQPIRLVARAQARRVPAQGERVSLRPNSAEAHVFDPATGERLGK